MEKIGQILVDWHAAGLTLPGERKSGDVYLVKHVPEGVLLGVADGLGHGEEAAAAASTALRILDQHAGESVISLLHRCHEALRLTRGVVMSLASFNAAESTLTWAGVGNVEGVLLRGDQEGVPRHESLLLRGGVIGHRLPRLYASSITAMRGDVLIFATDGIRSGFAGSVNLHDSPRRIAERILAEYGRGTDDALVLAARLNHGQDETEPGTAAK
jgi:phosphoserine phosphatase RsbX